MADPFEVRMRFTQQLQHLNASTSSATKAANYALRHAEHADDLHSCILEQLERNNMNNRANIMYFLPSLCDAAKTQGANGEAAGFVYTRMIERDILRIVDAVAPEDGIGAANVKVVRKVLSQLQGKGFLQPQTVTELEECIAGRDSVRGMGTSPPDAPSGMDGTDGGVAGTARHNPTPMSSHRDTGGMGTYGATGIRLDKRQVEQRIEEDRERHKRAREGIWAIPQVPGAMDVDAEVDKMWDETSEINEDDYALMKEETEERTKCKEYEEVA
ncbi:hypothetical protein MBLNU230_g7979t1 [Neophaeotheca triangularis]